MTELEALHNLNSNSTGNRAVFGGSGWFVVRNTQTVTNQYVGGPYDNELQALRRAFNGHPHHPYTGHIPVVHPTWDERMEERWENYIGR